MLRWRALCGGTISNTLCPCPTEGWILRDQDQEPYYEGTSKDIAAFFTAIQAGRRNDWIAKYFSQQYPNDVSDEGIVYDIIAHHKRQLVLSVAECEQCGRLWVQREPGVNEYRSYSPDESGYAAVLQVWKKELPASS